MILSLSCQAHSIQTSLPHKRTSYWFRSTQHFQTHTRPARTRRGHPRSPLPFSRPCRGFDLFAASSVDKDSMPEVNTDLLFAAAMPKEEIGALDFLKQQPDSDGRGVIVAIFDTGVDPGSEGLQITTDGKPKILDVVDGTGSGDVDTSAVVEAQGGVIIGIHGDKLTVNSEWSNPTGKWHVGTKNLFELVPGGLKKRIKQDRRKLWDEQQSLSVAKAWSDLSKHSKSPKPSSKAASPEESASASTDGNDSEAAQAKEKETGSKDSKQQSSQKLMKEELQAQVDLLKELAEGYDDPGPLLQCVVWHDGTHWRAAIDTSDMHVPGSGKGLLADFKPLTNYKAERQYGTFSAQDGCNFVCNIYEDGDVLSIVVDSGPHGTHVAGITAAHQPDNPSLNGIAPGAQIISCKIGDSRLGGMETGTGLTRALITVLDHKADLINMSFGEATSTPNYGRFIELANEVVNKHGVIFVSSAGNAGPALTTVGAPGGTSSAILSIGAYVSPAMAAMAHSVRQEIAQGQQYTWSSRGPTPDGATGVVLSAPGGAIAPVPQWTEQVRQLMNGTSMSSPNACGGIALLLSAMKQHNMAISPNRVRRALENTCQVLEDDKADAVLTYGRGLLQVQKAFEYVSKSEKVDTPDVRYEVTARRSDSAVSQRGILMRDPLESLKAVTYVCDVHPKLHEDAEMAAKLQVYDEVEVECSQPWLDAPGALILPHNGRMFEVKVDPSGLGEGLHYGEVQAFDRKAKWRGPLFRLPVTIIKPAAVVKSPATAPGQMQAGAPAAALDALRVPGMPGSIYDTEQGIDTADVITNTDDKADDSERVPAGQDYIARLGRVHFQPGTEVRRFLDVPEGATWAEMTLRAGNHDTPRNFMLRATQILPHTRYSETEARTYVSLGAHARHVMSFKLTPASTLEITLSQFWSSLGEGDLEVEVAFHGVAVVQGIGVIAGPSRTAKVQIRAALRTEKINPTAKLHTFQIPLRPIDSQMQPLSSERDQLPQGRTIHALMLTYKLSVETEGKHRVTVPLLNRYAYDGEFEGQMSMLHDANKRLVKVSDIYPEFSDLKKGDHTIRLQLRHDDAVLLDKMKDVPVVVERKLKEPVTVPVFATVRDAVKSAKPVKERSLYAGERVVYFVGPVPQDKLPKDAGPGTNLAGSLKLGLLQGSKEHAPGWFPVFYSCGPKSKAPVDKDGGQEPEKKEEEEPQLEHALWEAKLKFLQSMKTKAEAQSATSDGDNQAEALEDELLQSPPKGNLDKMRVLRSRLKRLSSKLPDRVIGSPGGTQQTPAGGAEAAELGTPTAAIQSVVAAADEAIALVDIAAMHQFVASRSASREQLERLAEEDETAGKKKKEMDEMKQGLIDALTKKCLALAAANAAEADNLPPQPDTPAAPQSADSSSSEPEQTAPDAAEARSGTTEEERETAAEAANGEDREPAGAGTEHSAAQPQGVHQEFKEAMYDLLMWVPTEDPQIAALYASYEASQQRPASAIKALAKAIDPEGKPPLKKDFVARAELFAQLGWKHWHLYEMSRIKLLFPANYPLF